MALEIKGLGFSYGKAEVLKDVSVKLDSGGFYLFIGKNGAGKTTLLKCLSGRLPIERGSIFLGSDKVDTREDEWKYRMGLVPADDTVIEDLSVREQLELIGRLFGLSGGEAGERAESLIRFFYLEDKSDEPAGTLSSGMRKKLTIALSLVHAPEIILLDEPLNSLDVATVYRLLELLEFLKENGCSILCTGHNVDLIRNQADRVFVIEDGTVRQEAPAAGGAAGPERASDAVPVEKLFTWYKL